MSDSGAFRLSDLRVELENGLPVIDDVSLEVASGEILGLVGESGSGKTTTALGLVGYARRGLQIKSGSVRIGGEETDLLNVRRVRRLRGRIVAYVPQDPTAALNPGLRIGGSIRDMLAEHDADRGGSEPIVEALESVHLSGSVGFARRFPHELSGGQQQRVALAIAIVCEPPLVVLDEPTTGLDVVTQAHILREIDRLRRERGLAMVYVTHDLAVVASLADRVAVMYAGRIVEMGPTERMLRHPAHPYTRSLIASIPDHVAPRTLRGLAGSAVGVTDRPPGCPFAPRCSYRVAVCSNKIPDLEPTVGTHAVRCFEWRKVTPPDVTPLRRAPDIANATDTLLVVEHLRAVYTSRRESIVAVNDVSFSLHSGECLALVGESGSGKTTIARCVAGLHPPAAGSITLDGVPLAAGAKARPKSVRRRCQIVFQNPYDSLNPRHSVGHAVARPARLLRGLDKAQAEVRVVELLEQVRLPARVARRFPAELSGGERQRVAIARALAAEPDVIVCDEITSALDVSVQAAVLELLADLRSQLRLGMLFITHNLAVVASIADRVLVLDRGAICEEGATDAVFSAPKHPYTRQLLEAAPRLPEQPNRSDHFYDPG